MNKNFEIKQQPNNTGSAPFPDHEQVSVKEVIKRVQDLFAYFYSRWRLIAVVALVGGALGVGYAYRKMPIFTAELTFVLESGSQGGMASYAGLASQLGINMGSATDQGVFGGENFLALMKSRLMVQKALMTPVKINNNEITLAEFYIQIENFREKWAEEGSTLKAVRFLPNTDPARFTVDQNSLMTSFHETLLGNQLLIERLDKKTSIIVLRVKSKNELFSKYFTEALIKEVSEFYIETKTKKSVDNLRILQHQTDSIRRALTLSMAGAASSSDANPNPNPAMQILRVPSQRKQGDVQVNQAILSQLIQNLEIAKMSLRTETPLIKVIDSPVLPLSMVKTSKTVSAIKGGLLGIVLILLLLTIKKVLATF